MNISRIVSIVPAGTYNGAHGLLYQLDISFEDNTSGQANAKSPKPPYKVGDEVGYEVTGAYPGGQKIKIFKDPYGQTQTGSPPARSAQPAQRPAPRPPSVAAPSVSSTQGITVGMAINNAVNILKYNAEHSNEVPLILDLPTLQHQIEQVAMFIISASRRLEAGQVVIEAPTEDVPY